MSHKAQYYVELEMLKLFLLRMYPLNTFILSTMIYIPQHEDEL